MRVSLQSTCLVTTRTDDSLHNANSIFPFILYLFKAAFNCSGYVVPGADKYLARPGRKQAWKRQGRARFQQHRDANCKVTSPTPLQGKGPKEIHVIMTETLTCFNRHTIHQACLLHLLFSN